jgi:hypothetical protein
VSEDEAEVEVRSSLEWKTALGPYEASYVCKGTKKILQAVEKMNSECAS